MAPPSQYSALQRRELIFPPDSVEAVMPVPTKRRRITSKDIIPVEAWRVMMALKSGQLAECTWALDVLSVLLYDDSTILYFGLGHLPGLLEVLLDHYRRCLNIIFGLTEDLEIGYDARQQNEDECRQQQHEEILKDKMWYQLDSDFVVPSTLEKLKCDVDINLSDKKSILSGENYTHKTRDKKSVKTKYEETLFLLDPDKKWDVFEGFDSGVDHWQSGGTDSNIHIQSHFENWHSSLRFVNRTRDVKKQKESSEPDCCIKVETESSKTESDESLKKSVAEDNKKTDSEDVKPDSSSCHTESKVAPKSPVINCIKEALSPCVSACSKTGNCTDSPKVDNESSSAPDLEIKTEPVEDPAPAEESTSKLFKLLNDKKVEEKKDDGFPRIRPTTTPKRKLPDDIEEEAASRDEPSLCIIPDVYDSMTRRCMCISTLLRNLSFVPGNDCEMSKHAGFLLVLGRLLLLHHVHPPKKVPQRHYDREDDVEVSSADSCTSLTGEKEWWWDMLHIIRENTLVTLSNIAGQLDLSPYPEEISLPLLDGLLHWTVCPSSYTQDPLPTLPAHSVLSPQRLALETLCKLSILENNVDLILATPPWTRIEQLFSQLSKQLNKNEDQVLREFSVVLLSNFAQADSSSARTIALHGSSVSHLITFVEQAEQSALQVANSQGINALRENPELMGTTLDMVRRAAGTLCCLARVPENSSLFLQHQQRLLALVMSQILDQGVASIVADVLFECSQEKMDMLSLSSVTSESAVS